MMFFKNLVNILVASSPFLLIFNVAGEELRIYQQDSRGNIQYHKPSAVVQKDGRVIETDSVGNKQYHNQQYQIKDGKIYEIDSLGNIQNGKNHQVIK